MFGPIDWWCGSVLKLWPDLHAAFLHTTSVNVVEFVVGVGIA